MLRMPTDHSPCQELTTHPNPVSSSEDFDHPILKSLRRFWQFSCFYGDYVSQPLENRAKRSILSQETNY